MRLISNIWMLYEDSGFIPAVSFGCLPMKRIPQVIQGLAVSPHQRGELGIYPYMFETVC